MATISYDELEGLIWLNGEMVRWQEAKVHVLTHGLHYASAVFEGQRVYDGVTFKLREHTERLFHSAHCMDFKIPYTIEEIEAANREVIAANHIVDGYVRPVAWRGSEMMGVSAQANRINVAIAAWLWPSYFDPEARMRGIRMQISQWRRPAPDCAPVHAKAAGLYMICTLSKHAAEAAGCQDALMLDWRGRIAEATGANIFFVKEGRLHTPVPDCFLDGITRRTVMGLARARGIEIVERTIMPDEMAGFEACFIAGTAVEVTPVSEIGPYKFVTDEITKTLMRDYDSTVRLKQAA